MKICVIGDLHFGARNEWMQEQWAMFFRDTFFPTLVERGIKEILCVGDFFENRESIDTVTMAQANRSFLDPIRQHGMRLTHLLGNHDIVFRDRIHPNSPTEFLGSMEYVRIIDKPGMVEFKEGRGDTYMLACCPWLCESGPQSNVKECLEFIDAGGSLLFGHFEVSEFFTAPGVQFKGGLPPSRFERWKMVLSGHFHLNHSGPGGRIRFIGTPYEITFSDCGNPKGFYILNIPTSEMEFIPNPKPIHLLLAYSETIDPAVFTGRIVKLSVNASTAREKKFDKWLKEMRLLAKSIDVDEVDDGVVIETGTDGEPLINVVPPPPPGNSDVERLLADASTAYDGPQVDKGRLQDYLLENYREVLLELRGT